MAFGYAMGQGRAALLMQNTGLGNLVTELMTLPVLYGLPLPLLVSWRGHYRENIEAQTILGERVIPMLRGLEIPVTTVDTPDDLGELEAGLAACFEKSEARICLLSPQLWEGEKLDDTPEVGTPRIASVNVAEEGFNGVPELTRYQAIQAILEGLTDEHVLMAQIGFPAREACAIKDRERNIYLLGALGSATLVGIGLAEARPDLQIIVLDGDGSFVLNPNQMLELGRHCPKNLTVVLLDNGSWGPHRLATDAHFVRLEPCSLGRCPRNTQMAAGPQLLSVARLRALQGGQLWWTSSSVPAMPRCLPFRSRPEK